MAHDVFISYSSRNKPVADAICAGLEAEKVRCWIAPRDVLPGQNYGEAIVHGIANCRVMVLVFSEATNVSQAVIREAERAMHHSKPIIPFRIEDTPMSPGLEFFLASCHWLDAIQPPMETHIAHLARSVKGLMGEAEPTRPAPTVTVAAKPNKTPWIIAGAAALALVGGFLLWKKPPTPPLPDSPPATSGLTLSTSLAGAGTGAIASHFSGGDTLRYRSEESGGVLTLDLPDAPAPGKLTVVSPTDAKNWIRLPTAELDLKLLNSGSTTAFFQRAVLEVSSSLPESGTIWLADGTRLPNTLSVRPLVGHPDAAPSASLGIAGPEDALDPAKLTDSLIGKSSANGAWEFPLPRAPRPGMEETLFGSLDGMRFEIPLAATPVAKPAQAPKDPDPLYSVRLRESGENYTVSCDLSQYLQAGEGDRFFLRLESPAPARHRFALTLEYDDGSGGLKQLKGPVVDAQLYPAR
jgi:TIR domain